MSAVGAIQAEGFGHPLFGIKSVGVAEAWVAVQAFDTGTALYVSVVVVLVVVVGDPSPDSGPPHPRPS